MANESTVDFLTGYLSETSLAVDNVFVWLMLFSFFVIPPERQKCVLPIKVFKVPVPISLAVAVGSTTNGR